ncbi:hypothetical protein Y1Q_0013466 [Alligator mississippiensis]|uniref:Uncharacterized protein n=1 Tax=Alligator mississippiensis TaxID=8496 RepID=A0A151MSE1_ALLMI|nr:hypothetical protein Y1Q_0013466 [Alligator mississippiensis]
MLTTKEYRAAFKGSGSECIRSCCGSLQRFPPSPGRDAAATLKRGIRKRSCHYTNDDITKQLSKREMQNLEVMPGESVSQQTLFSF